MFNLELRRFVRWCLSVQNVAWLDFGSRCVKGRAFPVWGRVLEGLIHPSDAGAVLGPEGALGD